MATMPRYRPRDAITENIILRHGCPEVIISDNAIQIAATNKVATIT